MEQNPTYEELEQIIRGLKKESIKRKKTEDALKRERDFISAVLSIAGGLVVVLDREGRIVRFNRACEQLTSYSFEEVQDKHFWDIFLIPEEVEPVKAVFAELRSGYFPNEHENYWVAKDGSRHLIMWSNTALLDHEGSVEYVIGTGIDITERKKAEEALRESEERHRLLLEVSPDPIVIYDIEGKTIYVNPAFEQTFGWILDELRGKRIDFVPEDNLPETKDAIERMLQGEKVQLFETRRLTKDGKLLDIQLSSSIFHDQDENLIGNIVILRDVTTRKRAEEALRKAHDELERRVEERTAELLEANEQLKQEIEERKRTEQALHFTQFAIDRSSDAAFWMDSDARFVYVNEAACSTLDYTRDELIKMTVHDIDPDFPKKIWPDHWAEVKRQGYFVIESHHRSKDGRIFPVEISINYLEFGGKEYNCAFARDISERKKVEKAIELSKKEWESTFDAMSDWVSLIDLKYRILRSNRAGENFVSLPTEEMIDRTCCELIHGKEGPIPECPMQKMLQTHQRETADLYVQEMNRWLRISVDPVMDDDGNLVQAVHIVRDITELKKMEEERLKSMKLESIGILSGGIAHDFNNFLSIIMGNIELAKDDIKHEVGISEFLTEAEKASLQSKELTKQLITFSKGGAPVKKIGLIGDLVKETINFTILGSNVRCEFLIQHDLWLTEFDEDQMKHAINNLIVNAIESMPNGGTIDVRLENINITAEQGFPLPEGKYVKISIRDHGVGIPEEHLSKIFDPYFSTKEMGIQKGMGLGLATTYSIINRHDGHITVESEVGVGTTFIIFLPAHEKDIRKLEPIEIPKPEVRTGRILVMDDEEMLRNLAKERLNRLGYDVELAKDGNEAIELYKKAMNSGKPFEAVILDLTIKKGMGGVDTIKKLMELDPQVRAIVSSGYSNDPVMTDFRKYGFIRALAKPYSKQDLGDALKKITKE